MNGGSLHFARDLRGNRRRMRMIGGGIMSDLDLFVSVLCR